MGTRIGRHPVFRMGGVQGAAGAARTITTEGGLILLRRDLYGCTDAIHTFHGLERFSENMDFSLLSPDSDFRLEPYFSAIEGEFPLKNHPDVTDHYRFICRSDEKLRDAAGRIIRKKVSSGLKIICAPLSE